ncbi:MAG: hypothetical protein SGJ27_20160 [Candidatus Melainabacteria bacterium]|nr:hypothetical protein [Candidatus Melainabacteria bacterium]
MIKLNRTPRSLSLLSLAVVALSFVAILPVNAQESPTLKGSVNAEEFVKNKSNPSLQRKNVPNFGDDFSQPTAGPGMDVFDAPAAAFDNTRAFVPPPQTFSLGASDQGGDAFQPSAGTPMASAPPQVYGNNIQQNMLLPPVNASADPDTTEHMQLQWDLWHRRVAETIFLRFDERAKMAFANSRPISCEASYEVTRDGRVINIRLLRKSDNFMYNAMLLNVLQSMNGNPLLQFPPGSQRQMVCKTGEFSRNCGMNGFRHTVNDNERINAMRAQMHR